MEFEMTTEGYQRAVKYLLKIGFTEQKLRDLDGYSTVGIANECFKEGKKLTGILTDGTMF